MKKQRKLSKEEKIEAVTKAFEKFGKAIFPFLDLMKKEKDRMDMLIAKEPINRGKILNFHLILENFIDRVLATSIPEYNPETLRIGFYNKIELLPKTNKFYRLFLDGVKKINWIRNRYAHDLDFELCEEDVRELRPIIELLDKHSYKEVDRTPIDIVEQFVSLVCTSLSFHTPELLAKSVEIRKEYPGIFDMFENIQKDCNTTADLVERYKDIEP